MVNAMLWMKPTSGLTPGFLEILTVFRSPRNSTHLYR